MKSFESIGFLTRWMFEFMHKILYGINSLNFTFGLMIDNFIQYNRLLFSNIFLDFLLRISTDQARFQIR